MNIDNVYYHKIFDNYQNPDKLKLRENSKESKMHKTNLVSLLPDNIKICGVLLTTIFPMNKNIFKKTRKY